MLADFYIPTLSNDMKIAVQKNHLGRLILYKLLDPSKKRPHNSHIIATRWRLTQRGWTELRVYPKNIRIFNPKKIIIFFSTKKTF